MKTSLKHAALSSALLALVLPIRGEETPAVAIPPLWEVHAGLSGDDLPQKIRESLNIDNKRLKLDSALIIHGFVNAETESDDWIVSLDVPDYAPQLWDVLVESLAEDWGKPDENGHLRVKDGDSGLDFIIVLVGDSLKFTNSPKNLAITLLSTGILPPVDREIHGVVNLQSIRKNNNAKADSRLFQLADRMVFSAGTTGAATVLDLTVEMVEIESADNIENAMREALDARLLDHLEPVLPKPSVSRTSQNEQESVTFTMELDVTQTDRLINAIFARLMDEEPAQSTPAPDSDEPDDSND